MRKKRWESKLSQFSYDHQKINTQLSRVRRSAGELSHMLDNLSPKNKEKEKGEEKEK